MFSQPELPSDTAPPPLPRGTRIALDVGKARIGVAASDPDGLLAMPVETVRRGQGDIAKICQIIADRSALVCYIGLPKHLRGSEGDSAQDARKFARRLVAASGKNSTPIDVSFIDERLTTVSATTQLREAGRKANRQRAVIDQQAAVIILQSALDTERMRGQRAGDPLVAKAPQAAERGTT